jgi:hypothetical protein
MSARYERALRNALVSLVLSSLSLLLCSCETWRGISRAELVDVITNQRPRTVRLTYDAHKSVLEAPVVRGDSLIGTSPESHKDEVGVPLSSISGAEVRQYNKKTAIIVLSTFAAVGVLIVVGSSRPIR